MGDDSGLTDGQVSNQSGLPVEGQAGSPSAVPDVGPPAGTTVLPAAGPNPGRGSRWSVFRWPASTVRAIWRRDEAWHVKVGVVAAVIAFPFVAIGAVATWHSAYGASVPAVGGPTGVATGAAPTPASPLTGTNDEHCAVTQLPTSATASDFTLCMLARGANGEMKKDSVTYPFGLMQVYVTYRNTGIVQQDDVTFRVKLPSGFGLVPGTTVAFNSLTPEGFRASDNILDVGLNLGSYAPGGNVSLYFEAKAAEPKAFFCGDNVGAATFTVASARSVKATGSVMTVLRSCVH